MYMHIRVMNELPMCFQLKTNYTRQGRYCSTEDCNFQGEGQVEKKNKKLVYVCNSSFICLENF